MSKETESTSTGSKTVIKNKYSYGGHSETLYGLGVLGAGFYFLEHANNLTTILWGIGKAILWPAILMYKILSLLHM